MPTFSYDTAGSVVFAGIASTPTFGYAPASGPTLSGQASTVISYEAYQYEATGSLALSGTPSLYGTCQPRVGGSLFFQGYCTVKWTVIIPPIPVTPVVLLPLSPATIQSLSPKLVRAYGREAARNGWCGRDNAGFVPVGTATTFQRLKCNAAPPGTEPHYGVLITDN